MWKKDRIKKCVHLVDIQTVEHVVSEYPKAILSRFHSVSKAGFKGLLTALNLDLRPEPEIIQFYFFQIFFLQIVLKTVLFHYT